MAAYIIANVSISDEKEYSKYTAVTPGIIEKYNGEFVVRGGPVETLEGRTSDARWVVLKFETEAQARAFYESPEYSAAKKIRQNASDSQFLLLQGYS